MSPWLGELSHIFDGIYDLLLQEQIHNHYGEWNNEHVSVSKAKNKSTTHQNEKNQKEKSKRHQ